MTNQSGQKPKMKNRIHCNFFSFPWVGGMPPRKLIEHHGHARLLLEFGVEPGDQPIRCAWCGWRNGAEQGGFFFRSDRKDRLQLHRCFPGPHFVMDGYVAMCDRCLPYTIQDHNWQCAWPGVWIVYPLRCDPIDVFVYGYANDFKVADALKQVWGKIPYRHRQLMRVYLRDDDRAREDGQTPVAWQRLRIETLPAWSNWGRGWLGCNMAKGHVIRLWATAVKRMNQKSLAALLAHELAHTYQRAQGSAKAGKSREAEAQGIAARWGFPNKDIFRA